MSAKAATANRMAVMCEAHGTSLVDDRQCVSK
jgi:hypothetical protein